MTHSNLIIIGSGAFITNNAYAYSSMTNGDSFAKKFAKGDWFKLTVSGKTATGTNTLDFYLSDFRSENEADHYILNTSAKGFQEIPKGCTSLIFNQEQTFPFSGKYVILHTQ